MNYQNQGLTTSSMARTITQPAIPIDTPLLNETGIFNSINFNERPHHKPYEYRAPTDLQAVAGMIKTTAGASSP